MNQIKAIGFDWGGVMFQYSGGGFIPRAATFLGVTQEAFRSAYFLYNHMVNKGMNSRGFRDADQMWESVLTELGKQERLDDFSEMIRAIPKGQVNQQMIQLVNTLKEGGWAVGLLSNNSAQGAQEVRTQKYDQLFDVALFSAEIDCMKPQAQAFQKLANGLNVNIDQLLFIDDSNKSLSTAEEVGYHPLLFKSVDQLRIDLHKRGIL
jgi:putative hydrolase of the HAD superfamily